MGFHAVSCRRHFPNHVPVHVVGVSEIDVFGDDEKGAFEAVFLQNGEYFGVSVGVAVVEGEDDGFGGEVGFAGDGEAEVV